MLNGEEFSFSCFCNHEYTLYADDKDYGCISISHDGLNKNAQIMSPTPSEIDELNNYPNTDLVSITGLDQAGFEYFIKNYGHKLKIVDFFKLKSVEDWSLLGTLPNLEYVNFFHNQRITSLWDMSGNKSLKGLSILDFSRLKSIDGIGAAPALKYFNIGNAIWSRAVIDSFMPLSNTNLEYVNFSGKKIADGNFSFLETMPYLKYFSGYMLTTEQCAWLFENYPEVDFSTKGTQPDRLKGVVYFDDYPDYSGKSDSHVACMVGKGKRIFACAGNEAKIQKCIDEFTLLKEKYRGKTYQECFGEEPKKCL